MNSWPANSAQDDTTAWTVNDLEHGDLIFCARAAGWLSFAGSIAGEPWRHVGALSRDDDGEWAVLETVGNSFELRKLRDFIAAYETYGVGRPDVARSCVDQATAWMHQKTASETEHIYAWDDLILAGIIAATHRHIGAGQREQLRSALAAAADAAKQRPEHKGVDSLTCSAFVQLAYDSVDDGCAIKHDRWRSARSWPPRHRSLDELFDGPVGAFEDAMQERNLLELFAQDDVVERTIADSQPKVGQVWEMLRMIVHAVTGWYAHEGDIASIASDGRWVTPGDLWRSPSVAGCGYLEKEEALAQLALES